MYGLGTATPHVMSIAQAKECLVRCAGNTQRVGNEQGPDILQSYQIVLVAPLCHSYPQHTLNSSLKCHLRVRFSRRCWGTFRRHGGEQRPSGALLVVTGWGTTPRPRAACAARVTVPSWRVARVFSNRRSQRCSHVLYPPLRSG